MKTNRKSVPADHEPIGIVIADGGTPESAPRFLAYVWGPGPELDEATLPPLELVGASA